MSRLLSLEIEVELTEMVTARMARIATRRSARADHAERRRHGLRCRHARRLTQTSAGPAGGEQEKENDHE